MFSLRTILLSSNYFFNNYYFGLEQFHQYQVVGRALPTPSDEHPKIFRMKLWATNEVRAKSKFWYALTFIIFEFVLSFWCCPMKLLIMYNWNTSGTFWGSWRKVKKSNGQVLAINEVTFPFPFILLINLLVVAIVWYDQELVCVLGDAVSLMLKLVIFMFVLFSLIWK